MIELHAHILPGLDDGPDDLEGSVALAAAAVAAGTRTLAATSHVNRGFGLDAAALEAARERLREQLARENIPLDVVQGGEIAPARWDDLDDDELGRLSLGGGPWILLECPFAPAAALEPVVDDGLRRGFRILLAHPERSPIFQRDPQRLGRMTEAGVLAQVTAGSFAGDFGEIPCRHAHRMLEAGLVHVLATDTHDPYQRPPDPSRGIEALERAYGDLSDQVEWMREELPAAILAGEPAPRRPPLPRARRRVRAA